VNYYRISIEGREVRDWVQPLFKAIGEATFGLLIACNESGEQKFLVHIKKEIGCFDKCEIGPSIQMESNQSDYDSIEKFFLEKLVDGKGVRLDVMLSEEGGRFYYEQNRNVVMQIDMKELGELPEDYLWVDYSTLNTLIQVNNCLNIQLRNLLSVLDM